MRLADLPLVTPLAEWVWGGDPSDDVSPETCLDQAPFLSSGCFSQLITKALGVAVILGSCLNKTPIMKNMMQAQSAAGMSRMAMYAESLVLANGAAYGMLLGHPLTAYGENLALLVQNFILVGLIWKFTAADDKGDGVSMVEKSAVFAAAAIYVGSVATALPEEYYYLLQAFNTIILVYSRGSQVYATYQTQHTGAQSIVTLFMNLAGNLARILTTLKETGDMAVLIGFLVSFTLNLTMAIQYFWYQANTEKFLQQAQRQALDQKKKKKE